MARVYSRAADIVRCQEAKASTETWRLKAEDHELTTPSWIGYCGGLELNPPATNHALFGESTAHRSFWFSHLLNKAYFHGKTPAQLVAGHGQHDFECLCSDLLSTVGLWPDLPLMIQSRLDLHLLNANNGKYGTLWLEVRHCTDPPLVIQFHPLPLTTNNVKHGSVWPERAAQAGATLYIEPPYSEGKRKSDPDLKSESPGTLYQADLAYEPVNQGFFHTSTDLIQIFIKTIAGKHFCMRLSKGSPVHELKKRIQGQLGIPAQYQNLIYSGYSLQDSHTLQQSSITNDSTIIINLRLCGGSSGSSSKNTSSFRDAVKGKKMEHKTAPPSELPGPYIVEQKPESPTLQVTEPEVNHLLTDLANTAIICRFNGFWPKSDALNQWIYSTWSPNCEVYLCPKGFFIVRFDTEQERDSIINQGPWFWGSAGLFTTPWFSDFDATTMKVSKMPVWVRMHGLPLHFWHHKVLIAIGNSLGKFLKMDEERAIRGIFTFARICVEVDLSEGLPDHITLNFNNTQWIQQLDYENTAFRCRTCLQTGHLQNNCPLARKDPRKTKKQPKKPKGWQNTDPIEEEDINEEITENLKEPDSQTEQKQAQSANPPPTHAGPIITDLQQEPQLEASGIKRTHSSGGSESDKESPVNTMENQLAIITPIADSGGWRRVEKKKGRKA